MCPDAPDCEFSLLQSWQRAPAGHAHTRPVAPYLLPRCPAVLRTRCPRLVKRSLCAVGAQCRTQRRQLCGCWVLLFPFEVEGRGGGGVKCAWASTDCQLKARLNVFHLISKESDHDCWVKPATASASWFWQIKSRSFISHWFRTSALLCGVKLSVVIYLMWCMNFFVARFLGYD